MMKELDVELAKRIVDFMNELVKIDADAVSMLCNTRVPCNKEMLNHPTVQAGSVGEDSTDRVGMIGILNGLCGVGKGNWGIIAASCEEDGGAGYPRVNYFLILEDKIPK